MAFAETLRKLGTLVGLYEKEPYSGGDDYNGYDHPDAPYQEPYGQPTEPEPGYQSTYGATGNYARAGARPRQSAPPQQQRYQSEPRGASYSSQGQPRQAGWQGTRPDNVIPMPERDGRSERDYSAQDADFPRQDARSAASASQPMGSARTTVICARRLEDAEQIINYLIEGVTVVLNLEELDDMLFRRVLDMISGAAFALNANIVRTSLRVYLIAPRNMVVLDEQQPREREGRGDTRDARGGYSSRW